MKGFIVLECLNYINISSTRGGKEECVQNGSGEQRRAERIWEIEASGEDNIKAIQGYIKGCYEH